MDGTGAFQRRRRDLRQADRADLAFVFQADQRLHHVLDRPRLLAPMDVEQRDMVDAEALQRGFERRAQMLGRIVEAAHRPVLDPGLGGDGEAVRMILDERADHFLRNAFAVDVGGVEMVDAKIESAGERAVALGHVSRPVNAAETHAAQSDCANFRTISAKTTLYQRTTLQRVGIGLQSAASDRHPPRCRYDGG